MLRQGNLGVAVAPLLAAKYNTGDRMARDWVAAARKLLEAETAELAASWANELVLGAAEAYRAAKASGDVALTLQALDRLWRMTGNDVTRTENLNRNEHHELPATPAELAAAVAEVRGCTVDEAAQWLLAQGGSEN